MAQLRQRLIDGASHGTLQQEFNLNKRTYFRYVRKIFEDDRKFLQEKNQEELERQLVLLEERYFFILGELKRIATDHTQSAQDQMQAMHSYASLSLTISKLFGDSPAIAALQLRKIEAAKSGSLFFNNNNDMMMRSQSLPPSPLFSSMSALLPPLPQASSSSAPEPEQQESEESSESEEEGPYDHEFYRRENNGN